MPKSSEHHSPLHVWCVYVLLCVHTCTQHPQTPLGPPLSVQNREASIFPVGKGMCICFLYLYHFHFLHCFIRIYEWISDSYCATNELHVHAKSHCHVQVPSPAWMLFPFSQMATVSWNYSFLDDWSLSLPMTFAPLLYPAPPVSLFLLLLFFLPPEGLPSPHRLLSLVQSHQLGGSSEKDWRDQSCWVVG